MNSRNKEIINTLEKIKASKILNSEVNQSIDKTIKKVTDIYREKTVKIAILGEFSSGKSTFINGILNEDILSYGDEPTTATNTIIKYGEKEAIYVVDENNAKKKINRKNIKLYIKEGVKRRECSSIEIINKNKYLKKGLVIVDTPGANINKYQHNIQRKRAIKESVVGVFLISCQSLTSNSFIEFLKENKNELQKIIFVITKVDMYEEEKISIDVDAKTPQEKLKTTLEYVAKIINKYSDIKQPKVFAISAKAFLEKRKLKVIDVKKSFEFVISEINYIALKDKENIIQVEIRKILCQIIDEVNYILRNKKLYCSKEIEKVNGEIQGFDNFSNDISKQFSDEMDKEIISRKNQVRLRVERFRKKRMKRIEEKFSEILIVSTFKAKVNKIVKEEYEMFEEKCNNYIDIEVRNLGVSEFENIEMKLKEYFKYVENTYKHLGIQRKIKIKKTLVALSIALIVYFVMNRVLQKTVNISLIVSSIIFCVSYLVQKKKVEFYISRESYKCKERELHQGTSIINVKATNMPYTAGGGLLIGACVGGPIGAIIGAGIGAIIGGLFSDEKLEEVKMEAVRIIERDLDTYCVQFEKNVGISLEKQKKQLEINLEKYIRDNRHLYNALLKGIEEYNSKKFEELRDKQKVFEKYYKELQKYT
ncbi:MAG: dynamin family protein [Clostridium sp.]